MRKLNRLNKLLIVTALVLVGLFVYKIADYKQWDRYYYTSSVSNPAAFPIHIFGIGFLMENGDYSGDFYNDVHKINAFHSDWGKDEYYEAYDPELLPNSLFVEYVDFRTQDYFRDTIALPQDTMRTIFREAKANNYLDNLSSGRMKSGLKYHVGIADNGHLVRWLIGNQFGKEFFRRQLHPKPFPKKIIADGKNEVIADKEKYLTQLFIDIPDSVKQQILQQDVTHLHYKDSIPIYFDFIK